MLSRDATQHLRQHRQRLKFVRCAV